MRTIPGNFIGALIGPGGKVIQELQKATGTTIVINEVDEQGVVEILGTDPDGIAAVLAKIDSDRAIRQAKLEMDMQSHQQKMVMRQHMKTLYQLVTIRVKVKQIKLVHLLIFKLE
jgi:polyribonucleotide nucleotidyltransferase